MTARRLLLLCGLALALLVRPAPADNPPLRPIPGIGPIDKVVLLHDDFGFTEGPAAGADGTVYFSDIPKNRIYKIDAQGKLAVFRDHSGHANGLMVNARGEVVACQMDGRVVAFSPDGKNVRVLADKYQGKRFNAPNDLVLDRAGGVYFTDPSFRAPRPLPQGVTAVYYIASDGKVTRLIDNLKQPNGVILSPDEKTLYVVPSGSNDVMAYAVAAPGKLGPGRVFCTLQGGGGDGLTVDTRGNLYITSTRGLQVFAPDGKRLGTIPVPMQPANVVFGGSDRKTLYITARTGLFTARMEATGHVFGQTRGK